MDDDDDDAALRLYFYCLSTKDVENVRTDQFGSNPGL